MTAFPQSDWTSSSVEAIASGMGPTPNMPSSSYATTVMSSPSLASVHQSSFDDSESTSLQECFDAATDLFMSHGEGASGNDSADGLPMDAEDASELLTAAAAAVAAAAIALPPFQEHYTTSSFPPSFQTKEEMTSGQPSVLDMAAFQAAVQSVAALRQQPSTSNSSIVEPNTVSALSPSQRRILPAAHQHASLGRQAEPSYRSAGYTPYPLGLPLSAATAAAAAAVAASHQVAANNFQANAVASTSFAVPSTVIYQN